MYHNLIQLFFPVAVVINHLFSPWLELAIFISCAVRFTISYSPRNDSPTLGISRGIQDSDDKNVCVTEKLQETTQCSSP